MAHACARIPGDGGDGEAGDEEVQEDGRQRRADDHADAPAVQRNGERWVMRWMDVGDGGTYEDGVASEG